MSLNCTSGWRAEEQRTNGGRETTVERKYRDTQRKSTTPDMSEAFRKETTPPVESSKAKCKVNRWWRLKLDDYESKCHTKRRRNKVSEYEAQGNTIKLIIGKTLRKHDILPILGVGSNSKRLTEGRIRWHLLEVIALKEYRSLWDRNKWPAAFPIALSFKRYKLSTVAKSMGSSKPCRVRTLSRLLLDFAWSRGDGSS